MNDNNNALPPISFVEATKKGFSNLFNFKGRARRSEYWWYVLTVALIFIVSFSTLCCCYGIMGIYQVADYVIVFTLLLFVAFVLPAFLLLSIQVRRMHDIGKNAVLPICAFVGTVLASLLYSYGIYIIISLTDALLPISFYSPEPDFEDSTWQSPILIRTLILACTTAFFQLILLVYTLKDSQIEENRYGKSTKYIE